MGKGREEELSRATGRILERVFDSESAIRSEEIAAVDERPDEPAGKDRRGAQLTTLTRLSSRTRSWSLHGITEARAGQTTTHNCSLYSALENYP